MAGAEPRGLGLRVDGDELVSERTGRRLARLADAEGAEAAVFTDPEQGTVYKVFRRGNGGSLGNRLVIDADGNALLDTGTEADVAEKVRVINALGGVPTEIVGRTEDGELVVKQPHGRRDVVDKDSARAVNAAARLVEIPDAVLPRPHGFGGLYYANIGGQDVVVDDLHPGNYVGDTLGRGRILDLATHRLTPEELARLPKLREWIEAQREHATATGPVQFAKRGEEPNAPVTPEDEAAAMADAEKAFEDLSPEAQARLRRVADKQQAEVERANAEVLRAHDQEGKPLPAPNGQPSKLTRGQWVRVRTPLFKRWFGDWDAVARATMPRAANTLAEAKTAAAAFVGQPIRNQRTGLSATVSNTNLGKMTSESAGRKSASMADHALAVANADRLFAEAVLDRTHADRDQEPTIRAIHRYVAPMLTPNGEVRAVKLTVKETTSPKNPNPLYSIEALEIENPPSVLARVSPDETGTHPQAGLSESTLQVLRSVNPAAVSKVVDANGEPLVVWHGTENDGFSVFRTEIGSGKTHGTGAFFSSGQRGASTYSGTHREAEIFDNSATDEDGYERGSAPGNYPVFLNIRDPAGHDFDGKNWNSYGGDEWFAVDKNGDVLEYFTNEEDANHYRNSADEPVEIQKSTNPDLAASTDDLARQARDAGADGAIFENVNDKGRHGQGYGWADKVFVVFHPAQIKSATGNQGTFTGSPRIDFAKRRRGARAPADTMPLAKRMEQWWRNLERIAPGLAKEAELRFGEADDLVDQGLARRDDLTGEEEAARMRDRRAKKEIFYLFERAMRRNTDARTRLNLLHEMGHAFWDTLDADTQEALQRLFDHEVKTKTGPLFDAEGQPREGLARGALTDVQEWFAERLGHANDAWTQRRLATMARGDTLFHTIAAQFRALLLRLRELVEKHRRTGGYDDALLANFREFLNQGTKWTGAKTRARVEFARRSGRDFEMTPELAAKTVPVVALPEKPLQGNTPQEVRAAAWEAAAGWINTKVTNADTGDAIELPAKAFGHGFGRRGSANVYITPALPDLMRTAVRVAIEAPLKGGPEVKAIHRYAAALKLGEQLHRVKLTVREMADGTKLYDHEATEMETPGGNLPDRISGEKLGAGPSPGASLTIGQLFGGVKPGARVQFAQRARTDAEFADALHNYDQLEHERDRQVEKFGRAEPGLLARLSEARMVLEESWPGWRENLKENRAETDANETAPTEPEPGAAMPPDDEGGIRPEVTRAKITAVTSASFKPVGSVLYDYEVTQIETPDGKILPHRISGEKLDNGPSSGASVTVGQMFGGVKPGTRVRIAQRVKTGAGTSDVLRNYDRLERERDWL